MPSQTQTYLGDGEDLVQESRVPETPASSIDYATPATISSMADDERHALKKVRDQEAQNKYTGKRKDAEKMLYAELANWDVDETGKVGRMLWIANTLR